MSYLLQKSDENFQAIDLLIAGKLFAPVIHCAYYSSLQLIICSFYKYTGISEDDAQKDIGEGGNSHNYFLNKFVDELKKLDSSNAAKFHQYFSSFKRKRVIADYYNAEIAEGDIKKAKECATKIKSFLKKVNDDGKCENIHCI